MTRPTFPTPLYADTKAVCERLDHIITLLEKLAPGAGLFDALQAYTQRIMDKSSIGTKP